MQTVNLEVAAVYTNKNVRWRSWLEDTVEIKRHILFQTDTVEIYQRQVLLTEVRAKAYKKCEADVVSGHVSRFEAPIFA